MSHGFLTSSCLLILGLSAGFGLRAFGGEPGASAALVPEFSLGAFTPQPALTIYLAHEGGAEKLRLTARRGARLEGDRLMVRFFDPDENLLLRQYVEPGQMVDSFGPGGGEIWGIPLQIPVLPQAGELLYASELPLAAAGVYQLRLTAGANNTVAAVSLPRPAAWGVSFQNGSFTPWDPELREVFIYVPPHAETLHLIGGAATLRDEAGAVLAELADAKERTEKKITVTKTDTVWSLTFADPKNWNLRAWGFPFIMCPTAEAARAIKASVEVLPDGTTVCHKFQARIKALLPELLKVEHIGRAEELLKPLPERREEWLKDPVRSQHLLGGYSVFPHVETALRGQCVDPAAFWAGALPKISADQVDWRDYAAKAAPENRWDRLGPIPGFWAGGSPHNGPMAENLARVAVLDAPFNPYYGKTELLYRAAAGCLFDLMTLGEDEVWYNGGAESDPYPGFMGFHVAQKTFPAFALAAPRLPAEVRELWGEALRHIVDRGYPDALVTCRNQSSHFLVAYQAFAEGTGQAGDYELAKAYARRFIAGLHPAGFAIEQCGPDATYNGMTHWHMGLYQRMSNDPQMLEAIRKSYYFFDHTVAPEPGGQAFGASNFAHRTADGFHHEQWGGARGIVGSRLTEVGVWDQAANRNPEKRLAEATRAVEGALAKLPEPKPQNIDGPRYDYFGEPKAGGVWPAAESKPFVRDIAGQLVAVKRPGYYAAIYVGHPAPDKHYIGGREKFRVPLANDAENTGAEAQKRFCTPFLGGGLSLFWTPEYGNALLAMNWTPVAHHGLLATTTEDKRYWEDYFATQYQLDSAAGRLTIKGRIESLPLAYERAYEFADQELRITLTLTAEAGVSLKSLVENLPVVQGPAKAAGAKLEVPGEAENRAQADKFTVRDDSGRGVEVSFGQAWSLAVQRNGPRIHDLQIGRVQVELPREFKAGETIRLVYALRPVK